MNRTFTLYIFLSFAFSYTTNAATEQEQQGTMQVTESSNLEEVFAIVKDTEIQTPEITPPSAVMVWVRSFGIAVAYKFYAVRDWVRKKFSKSCEEKK